MTSAGSTAPSATSPSTISAPGALSPLPPPFAREGTLAEHVKSEWRRGEPCSCPSGHPGEREPMLRGSPILGSGWRMLQLFTHFLDQLLHMPEQPACQDGLVLDVA